MGEGFLTRVLLTGAAGRIGRHLRVGMQGRYTLLRVTDRIDLGLAAVGEEVFTGDLNNGSDLSAMLDGIDCVAHFAGVSEEDTWENVLSGNIEAVYALFEAARRSGVRRIVFASSHHAVGFYRREVMLDETMPPRPDTRYGVSKVFGEALASLYADKHGLEIVVLRIGSCRDAPEDRRQLFTWISPADMLRLAVAAIEAPSVGYEIVYGVSANEDRRWNDRGTDRIGYVPQDNASAHVSGLRSGTLSEGPVGRQFHGGGHCALEFEGDPERVT
jgi:uronate dehydrogenase